jgi:L,D-peptidoglycan transpeptidase YkuD (ErfK/YbiS/YcfS/YnhG family)
MRIRNAVLAVAGVLSTVAAAVAVPAASADAATSSSEVVTVTAPTASSTYATVEAWSRQADGRFKRVAVFTSARVGSQGIGRASEATSHTPAGQFPLSQPFGVRANPGTSLPYLHVDRNDVWTGSTGSVINQHRRCAPGTCPSGYGAIERLSSYPGPYSYGVFIGYNAPAPYGTGAVRGAGSAFFLHVKNAYATGGCVAVAQDQMVWLLRWLRADAHPILSIGVGAAAYAPIPHRYA